ncbi:MAG: hypothetical protein PCFJNLEI_02215 [Verrucomicrobiae bacterium]|nr:hypothetical protein [Verrucomicrobiae bacterium]
MVRVVNTPVSWYRTPLDKTVLMELHERSDWRGAFQTLGFLGILIVTGGTAMYSFRHWPWWATGLLVFGHGMVASFYINGVHELMHGTVFRTKILNRIFYRVLLFFSWVDDLFEASHVRHHQYTLHPAEDGEVVLPIKIMVRDFFRDGFVAPHLAWKAIVKTIRQACGKFVGDWELSLCPASDRVKRRRTIGWARTVLVGHGLILAVSIYYKLWLLPVLTTFAPFFGGWLFFLCNSTQHIGLQDNVPDFRLCCRTFYLNPFVRFLYWQMNYHTEHHMYAAVPCYKLGKLHQLIKHDLPPCPRGIVATWREIAAIQKIQETNPAYQHVAPLPN